jgi:phytanoyl-CoA hydroxylase
MISELKVQLRKAKKSLKKKIERIQYRLNHQFGGRKNSKVLDFDPKTLPFLDRESYSFKEMKKNISSYGDLPYDLEQKLNFFREYGYVVLENCLPQEAIDSVWNEIEYLTENHKQYDIDGLAHRFNDQKETPIRLIPQEKLKGIGTRFIDYHDSSIPAKKLITHPNLAPFLQASLNPNVTVFQSLIFRYSSQQDIHQDFPWVTTKIPSHLAAAWIPMEDVHVDAGPLFYYPKSHLMKKFDFGKTGILYDHEKSLFSPDDFSKYLTKTCAQNNLKKEVLLIKKGDILIWHGALAHGGMPINDIQKTRKSFVVHYSTTDGHPYHRRATEAEEKPDKYNGITVYSNPKLAHQKDLFR